jgi:hypothetical protein
LESRAARRVESDQAGRIQLYNQDSEGYAILKINTQSSSGPANEDTKRLLALVVPSAVRYGPDVGGFNDAVAVFTIFPDNPNGWNRALNPSRSRKFTKSRVPVP